MKAVAIRAALLGIRAAIDALISSLEDDSPKRKPRQSDYPKGPQSDCHENAAVGLPQAEPVGLPSLAPSSDLPANGNGKKRQQLGQDKSNTIKVESESARASAAQSDCLELPQSDYPEPSSVRLPDNPVKRLRFEMANAWDGVGGIATSGTNRARIAAHEPLLRRIATEQGKDPMLVFTAAIMRFKADPDVRRKHLGLGVFLSQLESWCTEPSAAVRGPAPVAPSDSHIEPDPEWMHDA